MAVEGALGPETKGFADLSQQGRMAIALGEVPEDVQDTLFGRGQHRKFSRSSIRG